MLVLMVHGKRVPENILFDQNKEVFYTGGNPIIRFNFKGEEMLNNYEKL